MWMHISLLVLSRHVGLPCEIDATTFEQSLNNSACRLGRGFVFLIAPQQAVYVLAAQFRDNGSLDSQFVRHDPKHSAFHESVFGRAIREGFDSSFITVSSEGVF